MVVHAPIPKLDFLVFKYLRGLQIINNICVHTVKPTLVYEGLTNIGNVFCIAGVPSR